MFDCTVTCVCNIISMVAAKIMYKHHVKSGNVSGIATCTHLTDFEKRIVAYDCETLRIREKFVLRRVTSQFSDARSSASVGKFLRCRKANTHATRLDLKSPGT